MGSRSGLGELEQLILLSILRLEDRAFGPDIARDLEDSVGRRVTRGALYSTLNRLEEKGLLGWIPEKPVDQRAVLRAHDEPPSSTPPTPSQSVSSVSRWARNALRPCPVNEKSLRM